MYLHLTQPNQKTVTAAIKNPVAPSRDRTVKIEEQIHQQRHE